MGWKEEQNRLQALWDEVESEEAPDDKDLELALDEDVSKTRCSDSELGQKYNDQEEISLHPAKILHFLGNDNKTRWIKHCSKKTSRTRRDNIIVGLPGVRVYGKQTPKSNAGRSFSQMKCLKKSSTYKFVHYSYI